jgi:AraC-like DNA-binding protein
MASGQASMERPASPATGPFEMVRRRPALQLQGIVTDLIGFRELVPLHSRQTEVASLTIPLVISFGEAFAIGLSRTPGANDRFASFAAGLHAGPVVIDSFGRSCCVQVNFTPLGARRFLGLPMSELTDRMVTLDEILGTWGRRLRQMLGEQADWHRRLDLAEQLVTERLMQAPPPSAEVAWALDKIVASGGRSTVTSIASEIGWSRKHLAQRFADQAGLGPKAVARIVRFTRAAGLASRVDGPGWAEIAAECGYADQAHLVREFRALAGATPKGLASLN